MRTFLRNLFRSQQRRIRRQFHRPAPTTACTETLEQRLLLTTDEALWAKAEMIAAQAQAQSAVPPQSQPDSTFWAGVGGFFSGVGTGLYNMGVGVVSVVQNVVTMPIDLVGTTVDTAYTLTTGQSLNYQPISWYGQASQAAIQSGTPWYYVSGQTVANAATFGVYGLVMTAYCYYYQTGDLTALTALQQTAGAFVFTVGVTYYVKYLPNPAKAPTYNLGGEGEVPGAINVQPPASPFQHAPVLIAPSNALPIPPASGNVIVNSSPIFPQGGLPALGPPYSPTQILSIAQGGFTIKITQVATTPGVPTIGQAAVISAAPVGSKIVVTPLPPDFTTVVITTPTPITTTVAPIVPVIIQAPNGPLVTPQPQDP